MQKHAQSIVLLLVVSSVLCTVHTLAGDALSEDQPSVPQGQQVLEFVLRLGSEFGVRQRYTFEVDRPGTIDVYCTWAGSAKTLTGILNGPVGGRTDKGSPIHMTYRVDEDHLKRSKKFSLSVVNFHGGEARGILRLSYPSDPRYITVTQVSQAYVNRVLSIPERKRAAARIAFDKIGHESIAKHHFSGEKINGSNDETNQLMPGSILLCKTSDGRLSKVLVEKYGYNLILSWVTYEATGEINSQGQNLRIRGTWSCDLDRGKESSEGADFWWEQVTERKRFLVPKNGAVFAKFSPQGR